MAEEAGCQVGLPCHVAAEPFRKGSRWRRGLLGSMPTLVLSSAWTSQFGSRP
jgi:hypothetical protein